MAETTYIPTRRKGDSDEERAPLRVLAVDDDPAYLRRLRLVLSRAGFDVVTANDGPSAIEMIRRDGDIGVLISDLAMPDMDGIETVRRAREASPFRGLYTVLLTAFDGVDVKLRALDSGLDDFLTKTSSDQVIVAKLRSAARRLEMERRLQVENETLQTLALTDELTGVANRRALYRQADSMLSVGTQMSAVLLDLNRFKQVNDRHGHLMGDRILSDIAGCLKANTRVGDVIARYGGDEFVLLLPNTAIEEARALTTRIAVCISDLRWSSDNVALTSSVTIGLAASRPGSTIESLLAECDLRLYEAKRRAQPRSGEERVQLEA